MTLFDWAFFGLFVGGAVMFFGTIIYGAAKRFAVPPPVTLWISIAAMCCAGILGAVRVFWKAMS